ncbi:uncharacterized protein LOC119595118 isoform X2 [Penaeus monodon]|uniref:uncharacterized protein LOC119595118 isoform X2 n=1 Tax=Penaeus monodon TaxID=6687 RepID=UPI0018A70B52|nr:uncharacterized protein LOC119595118 isoform X2 [Penaeus monodon]
MTAFLRSDTNATESHGDQTDTEGSANCWCGSLRNRAIAAGVLILVKSLAGFCLGIVYGIRGYPEAWGAFATGLITTFVFTPILFYGIWKESRKWLAVWFAWIAILTALGLIGSAVAMIKSAYVSALAIVGVLFNFTLMVLLLYLIYIYMQSLRSREPLVEGDTL